MSHIIDKLREANNDKGFGYIENAPEMLTETPGTLESMYRGAASGIQSVTGGALNWLEGNLEAGAGRDLLGDDLHKSLLGSVANNADYLNAQAERNDFLYNPAYNLPENEKKPDTLLGMAGYYWNHPDIAAYDTANMLGTSAPSVAADLALAALTGGAGALISRGARVLNWGRNAYKAAKTADTAGTIASDALRIADKRQAQKELREAVGRVVNSEAAKKFGQYAGTHATIGAGTEAISDAGSIYDELRKQGLSPEEAAAKMNQLAKDEMPYLMASNFLTGGLLSGGVGKLIRGAGRSAGRRAAANFGVAVPADALGEGFTEMKQGQLQNEALGKPYGTIFNPLPEEQQQGVQAFLTSLPMGILGGARGTLSRPNDLLGQSEQLRRAVENQSEGTAGSVAGNPQSAVAELPTQQEAPQVAPQAEAPTTGDGLDGTNINSTYFSKWESSEGATDLTGIQGSVQAALNQIGQEYYAATGETLTITGGAEKGAHAGGENGHEGGWKADVDNGGISNPDLFTQLCAKYGAAVGDEGDHFDLSFNSAGGVGGTQIATPESYLSDNGGGSGGGNVAGWDIANAISQKLGGRIPAAWILAQMRHESANFDSDLAREDHNYGGIKNADGSYRHFDSDEEYAEYAANNLAAYAEDGIFDAQNIDEFSHALHEGGYYTADEGEYSAALRNHLNEIGGDNARGGNSSNVKMPDMDTNIDTSAEEASTESMYRDFANYWREVADTPQERNMLEGLFSTRNKFVDSEENRKILDEAPEEIKQAYQQYKQEQAARQQGAQQAPQAAPTIEKAETPKLEQAREQQKVNTDASTNIQQGLLGNNIKLEQAREQQNSPAIDPVVQAAEEVGRANRAALEKERQNAQKNSVNAQNMPQTQNNPANVRNVPQGQQETQIAPQNNPQAAQNVDNTVNNPAQAMPQGQTTNAPQAPQRAKNVARGQELAQQMQASNIPMPSGLQNPLLEGQPKAIKAAEGLLSQTQDVNQPTVKESGNNVLETNPSNQTAREEHLSEGHQLENAEPRQGENEEGKHERKDENAEEVEGGAVVGEHIHTKTGKKIPKVTIGKRVPKEIMTPIARKYKARWDGKYAKAYLFKTEADAQGFAREVNEYIRGKSAQKQEAEKVSSPAAEPQHKAAEKQQEAETPKSKRLEGKYLDLVGTNGRTIRARYVLMEAEDVVASNNAEDLSVNKGYPQELQPRDRGRAVMREQVQSMAAHLRPEDLGAGRDPNQGAPVVRPDGVVLNGNGRVLAIERAQESHKTVRTKYIKYLLSHADEFGLDADKIKAWAPKRPILVRMLTEMPNKSQVENIIYSTTGGARLGAGEQAEADAKKLNSTSIMDSYEDNEAGSLETAGNAGFVNAVLYKIADKTEINGYTMEDGSISAGGINRVKRALFAKAFGDSHMVSQFSEAVDGEKGNITKALLRATPLFAKYNILKDHGEAHDLGTEKLIVEAVTRLEGMRASGKKLAEELKRTSLFDRPSPEVTGIMIFMDENKFKPAKMGAFFRAIAQGMINAGNPEQTNMFAVTLPSDTELIVRARDIANEGGNPNQTSLFGKGEKQETTRVEAKAAEPQEADAKDRAKRIVQTRRRNLRTTSEAKEAINKLNLSEKEKKDALRAIDLIEQDEEKKTQKAEVPTNSDGAYSFGSRRIKYIFNDFAKKGKPVAVEDAFKLVDEVLEEAKETYGVIPEKLEKVAKDAKEAMERMTLSFTRPALINDKAVEGVATAIVDEERKKNSADNSAEHKEAVKGTSESAVKVEDLTQKPQEKAREESAQKRDDSGLKTVYKPEATYPAEADNFKGMYNDKTGSRKGGIKNGVITVWDNKLPKAKYNYDVTLQEVEEAIQSSGNPNAGLNRLVLKKEMEAGKKHPQYREEVLQALPEAEGNGRFNNDGDSARRVIQNLYEQATGRSIDHRREEWGAKKKANQKADEMIKRIKEIKNELNKSHDDLTPEGLDALARELKNLRQDWIALRHPNHRPGEYRDTYIYEMDKMIREIPGTKKLVELRRDEIAKSAQEVEQESTDEAEKYSSSKIVLLDQSKAATKIIEATIGEKLSDTAKATVKHVQAVYNDIDKKLAEEANLSQRELRDLKTDLTGAMLQYSQLHRAYQKDENGDIVYSDLTGLPIAERFNESKNDPIFQQGKRLEEEIKNRQEGNAQQASNTSTASSQETSESKGNEAQENTGEAAYNNNEEGDNTAEGGTENAERDKHEQPDTAGTSGQEGDTKGATPVQEGTGERGEAVSPGTGGNRRPDLRLEETAPEDGQAVSEDGDTEGVRASVPREDGRRENEAGGRGNVRDGREGTSGTESSSMVGGSGRTGGRRASAGRVDSAVIKQVEKGENYHIDDPSALFGGSPKVRFSRNRKAIETAQKLERENRLPTQEEKDIMAAFTGWGSFGQQLFQGNWKYPAPAKGWEEEDAWLRDHLGEEAWKDAQTSIINAHYTSPEIVQAIWDVVTQLGFKGGRVLEPSMGVGNFFGLMPKNIMQDSKLTGVEMDSMTGRIAKMLYPQANIKIKPYQDAIVADGSYDLIVGNVPFSNGKPASRRYGRFGASLHDFFFLKGLDELRPGGLMVAITSSQTMDKKNRIVRAELARKAELVGAFRFPTGSFKDYAGTSVVTDLIILRKREKPLNSVANEVWVGTENVEMERGRNYWGPLEKPVNSYYVDHPENVLGKMTYGKIMSGYDGMDVVMADDFADTFHDKMMKEAESLGKIYQQEPQKESVRYIPNDDKDRIGTLQEKDGELYIAIGDESIPMDSAKGWEFPKKTADKTKAARIEELKKLVNIRKLYNAVSGKDRLGESAKKERAELKKVVEAYIKEYATGRVTYTKDGEKKTRDKVIYDTAGMKMFKKGNEPAYYALASLQSVDSAGHAHMAAVLDSPVGRVAPKLDNPTIQQATILQRNESMDIDLNKIAEMSHSTVDEVKRDLAGIVFKAPDGSGKYYTKDQYLSGNVRRKLREAQAAYDAGDDEMRHNIEALKKAIPDDIPCYNIEVKMGAPWVGTDVYRDFIGSLLDMSPEETAKTITVSQSPSGRWSVEFKNKNQVNNSANAKTIHGHEEYPFDKLLAAALNHTKPNITSKNAEGKLVFDAKATDEVKGKIDELDEKLSGWLWQDEKRRNTMESLYNETMNNQAAAEYDGSFMDMQGMMLERGNKPFNLRQHQINAIYKGLCVGSGLYAHEVGTGKTYTMGGLALEARRFGLAKKPMILAHNANSAAVAKEIQEMYPYAKILYLDNLGSKEELARNIMRIKNDDWDVVVVPHSQIVKFTLNRETLEALAEEDIMDLEEAARERLEEIGKDPKLVDQEDAVKKIHDKTAKDLVKQREKIRESIIQNAYNASSGNAASIEDLGIDMVIVDEAHEFKKPPISTKMTVKGLNKGTSKRSMQLSYLTRYIMSTYGRGVHLFTGTPITNTIQEIYNMARYVMPDTMQEANVKLFDDWYSVFANSESNIEYTAKGDTDLVERLSSFVNVPELRLMMSNYIDTVFADDMPEMKPRETSTGKTLKDADLTADERDELMNGRTENPQGRPYKQVINEVIPLTAEQKAVLDEQRKLAKEWDEASNKTKVEWTKLGDKHTPLAIDEATHKAAQDVRLVDYDLKEPEGDTKEKRVAANVKKIYDSSDKAAQVIMMDRYRNDTSERTRREVVLDRFGQPTDEIKSTKYTVKTYNLEKGIVKKLVDSGIPRSEIAIVDGTTSPEKKAEIAARVNRCEIRVVIGSTSTLGTGVNMQENLRAIHHVDAPYMPGELEQRNGRAWRQGNKWNTVLEYRYITEKLDGRRWQILSTKSKFISAFMHGSVSRVLDGDAVADETDDISQSLSESTNDPRFLIRDRLSVKVKKLQRKKDNFEGNKVRVRDNLLDAERKLPGQKAWLDKITGEADAYARYLDSHEDSFEINIAGKAYTERKEANDALDKAIDALQVNGKPKLIGRFAGLNLFAENKLSYNGHVHQVVITSSNEVDVSHDYSMECAGSVAGIERKLQGISKQVERAQAFVTQTQNDIKTLKNQQGGTFSQQSTLDKLSAQLKAVEEDLKKNPEPVPQWLIEAAPLQTDVAYKGNKCTVVGYSTGDGGPFLELDTGAEKTEAVPWNQVTDTQGMALSGPVQNSVVGISSRQADELRKQAKSVKDEQLTKQERTYSDFAKSFGATVQWIEADSRLNGYAKDGVIYLNRNAKMSKAQVFWHELFHLLKANNEDLYNDVMDVLGITDAQRAQYLDETGRSDVSGAAVNEEMLADAMIDVARRNGLMSDLISKAPDVFTRLKMWAQEYLARFISALHKPAGGLTTKQRDELVKAFKSFSKQAGTTAETKYSLAPGIKAATDKLKEKAGLKQSDLVETVENRDENELGFVSSMMKTPSRLAQTKTQIKPYIVMANRAMQLLTSLRSSFDRHLTKAWKGLSKKEHETLNNILLNGDAMAHEYTEKELEDMDVGDKVISSYKELRRQLNRAYRLINEAYRRPVIKSTRLSDAGLEELRTNDFVEVMRVQDYAPGVKLVTYKEYQNEEKDAILWGNGKLPVADGVKVQVLSTEELPDGTTRVRYRAGKAVNKWIGYVPHIFHEFLISYKNADGDTVILGSGKTIKEAVELGEKLIKEGKIPPNAASKVRVAPKVFNFDKIMSKEALEEFRQSGVTVGDQDYEKMTRAIAEKFDMSLADAREALEGIAHKKARHRFNGNVLTGKGVQGYEQDMQWAIRYYLFNAARYYALETEFKPRAISMYERQFGDFKGDQEGVAKYVQDYINDINGNPTALEKSLSTSIKNSFLGKFLTYTFGDRVVLSLASEINKWTTYSCLGCLNVSSAMLNFTQLINAAGLLGDAAAPVKCMARGLHKKYTYKDAKVLLETGVLDDIGLDSGAGYDKARGFSGDARSKAKAAYQLLDKIGQAGMLPFKASEALVRRGVVLAAYDKAIKEGKSHDEAIKYAKEINRRCNFDYSVVDAPNIFRRGSIISQLALQFKKYGFNQLALMADMCGFGTYKTTPKQRAIFWGSYFILVGLCGFPALDWLDKLLGNHRKTSAQECIIAAAGDSYVGKKLAQTAMYGLPGSLFGVSLSNRAGLPDVIPTQAKDVMPPLINKVQGFITDMSSGNTANVIRDVSPGLYNQYAAWYTGVSTDKRGRINNSYDDFYSKCLRAIGFKSTQETIDADVKAIMSAKHSDLSAEKQAAVDDFIRDSSTENAKRLKDLGITKKQVDAERKKKQQTKHERTKKGAKGDDDILMRFAE